MIRTLSKSARFVRSAALTRKPVLAYVGGWLGKRNLGDDALLAAYRRLFPAVNFVHFDGGRVGQQLTRLMPGIRSGMLAGGTLIGQSRIWLEIARQFLKIRPNLTVFGTGVASSLFWPGEPSLEEWKPVLRQCRYLGVRGPRSARLLEECGIGPVEVVGDPVITFAAESVSTDFVPNSLGLNIGVADQRMWGSERRVCEETSKLAILARNAGYAVTWFVIWPKDMDITREAAERSETAADIRLLCDDHAEFMEQVRPLSVFVGMKLHATVLATCALTPSIMLEYRPKCRDYMESIGQAADNFRTDSFVAADIWERVRYLNDHRNDAAVTLAQGIHPLQKKQLSLASHLVNQIRQVPKRA